MKHEKWFNPFPSGTETDFTYSKKPAVHIAHIRGSGPKIMGKKKKGKKSIFYFQIHPRQDEQPTTQKRQKQVKANTSHI
jgi:hypothetical protein